MEIKFHEVLLKKRFPLAISRGVRGDSSNLFVAYHREGITGWGEAAPGKNENAGTIAEVKKQLIQLIKSGIENLSPQEITLIAREMKIAPCALAGLDIAIWDWKAKKANVPLHRLLNFPLPTVPTSVTIGINTPEVVKQRIPLLLDGTSTKALKVKLGSPEGLDGDKDMFAQVLESAKKYDVKLRVDANGGWNTPDAIHMMKWLADRGVDYIEQPLEEGQEAELKYLFPNRPLPIFLDESCRYADDIHKWAKHVDGVNIKLMKCGGVTEALKIIETAKFFSLKTMIGCMSESSVSIAAAASISGAIDHIDLDSHYNLAPDPATGVRMSDGISIQDQVSGHGGVLKEKYYA